MLFAARVLVLFAYLSAIGPAVPFPVDEIIVTGERVPRTVRETPSSVLVLDARSITANPGADRIEQLIAQVPNLQLGTGGEGPAVRGQDSTGVLRDLPAFLGGNRPRMTLQVDGRAISYNELAFGATPVWDVRRVEVFRSPQTTTQGRNSIAGAIFVETNDPGFAWEGRGRAVAGSDELSQLSAAVSGPLVPGELALRVAGDRRRSLTGSRIVSPARGGDPNRDDYDLVRVKLLAVPAGVPGLSLLGTYAWIRADAPQVEGVRPPLAERRDRAAIYGIFSTDVQSLTLRGDYSVGGALRLTATLTAGKASIQRFAPPGFGEARNTARDRSGELVARWQPSARLGLVGGVSLASNSLEQRIDLTAAALGVGAFTDLQESLGLFGEAEWRLAPRLRLTAGGRYQRDRQRRSGTLQTPGRVAPLAYDGRFEALLPKVALSFAPAEPVRVGLSVQRAYNPGGTTLSLNGFVPDEFAAEALWAKDLFGRATLAGGALELSSNLFHYAHRDAQRSLTQALVTPGGIVSFADIGNAPRAWSRGAEVQLRWHPSPRLMVQATAGLLRTRLTQAQSASDPLLGKQFQRAPHFTGSAAFDWRPAASLSLSGQLRHHSAYFSDDANDPARRIAGSSTLDVRAAWRRGPVTLFGYIRNLFDEFHLTYLYPAAQRLATAGEARRVGVGVETSF